MDKTGFVYRLKGLREPGWAGKALYRACTDVGQKPGEQKIRRFCTSGAVDMQRFFHRRLQKQRFSCLSGNFSSRDCLADRTVFSGVATDRPLFSVDKTRWADLLPGVRLRAACLCFIRIRISIQIGSDSKRPPNCG